MPLRNIRLRSMVIAGVAVALAMAVAGIFAPLLSPYDPSEITGTGFVPPGGYSDDGQFHLLGTNHISQDILSQIVASFRTYLYIGLVGTGLGILAAWLLVIVRSAGNPDLTANMLRPLGLSFFSVALLTFPASIWPSLLFVAAFGGGLWNTIGWAGAISSLLPMSLVYESVRASGASSSPVGLAVRRGAALFPVGFSMALFMGLFVEATLSYLGLGTSPFDPSLGNLLERGSQHYAEAPWMLAFPLGVTVIAVGAFLLIVVPVGRSLAPAGQSSQSLAETLISTAGEPAGFGIRVLAEAIDGVILSILIGVVYLVALGLPSPMDDAVSIAGYSTAFFAVTMFSPGKRRLGLRLLMPDGSGVGLGRKFCRSMVILGLSWVWLFLIGFLMIAFRRDRRGLHDLICDTVVVRPPKSGEVSPDSAPADSSTGIRRG